MTRQYKKRLNIFNTLTEKEKMWSAGGEYSFCPDSEIIYSNTLDKKGFIEVYRHEDRNPNIFIVVNSNSRKEKIGRRLLSQAFNYLTNKRIKFVDYIVLKDNVASIKLAESFNYLYVSDHDFYSIYHYKLS